MKTAAVVAAFAFLGISQMAQARTYKVGMIHWAGFSPLNVADAKGFWKEQGLDVKVVNFGSNQELYEALANKTIDLSLDMIGSWVGMALEGTPLTVLAETDWSNGGDKIIAKKDADPKKLKGSTIGVYMNKPSVTFFLNKYLSQNGVTLADVTVRELEPDMMTDAFLSNKFPVIVNYDPQALRAEREGNGTVVATSATYSGVIPEGFVSHRDVAKDLPKADLVKFFKGWSKAVKWSKTEANWKDYMSILNGKTFEGEKPYSEADLKGMLSAVLIHDDATLLERNKAGGGLENYLKEVIPFAQSLSKGAKKTVEPKDLMDTSALLEALK